jgi:hypothetical protein
VPRSGELSISNARYLTAFHLAISSIIRAFNLSSLEGRPAKKATA